MVVQLQLGIDAARESKGAMTPQIFIKYSHLSFCALRSVFLNKIVSFA